MTFAESLPHLTAFFNLVSLVCVVFGWRAIKRGANEVHRRFMLGAVTASGFFLTAYLTRQALVGTTHYQSEGLDRIVYLTVLFSHMPLAATVVPLVLLALFYALRGRFDSHRRVVRWLLPIWMYVSVTGIIVYLMLYFVQSR